MRQRGFTLVELMISLTLGLLISAAIVQVMVSSQVTERLNRAVASAQENGRFFISRMRSDLLITGFYDPLSPNLSRLVDVVDEASFLQNRPVILPGDFINMPALGSEQGANGGSDRLVVAFQGTVDCRGLQLGYNGEEFFVVNEYFLDGEELKCRGFDGRVLRGQKAAAGNSGNTAISLMDNVVSFQVLYGVGNSQASGDFSGRPVSYVTADQLPAQRALNAGVVAIRLAALVKGDGEVIIDPASSFKLLNESSFTPQDKRLYKLFETTISIRNIKNQLRSRKI
ncbi:PilW family protein [Aliiglaciecola sp. CAU 1673]|uniref:PilW family protein n=1 Tax=Aliiglaciecola sp. CAU 1673 TaxID=3032595 RepID=UPI0023DC0432|nr:PilW family protein [Aliiglaciecola sp. CAU 1673]MDF2178225.1 PilW family protein [Aliiglaciecola sp. CAU 1673]